jgi:hypothetical protein
MQIHNASFTMVGGTQRNNESLGNTGRGTNVSSPGIVVQSSANSQINKMIEKIQELMQKVYENEHYDMDTKEEKIKEYEKQIEELEKAKVADTAETMLGGNKEAKENSKENSANNNTVITQSSADGDILELDTATLLRADNSLKDLKEAHSLKVRSEGDARVLASEIEIDKGRGVDTTRKEQQLDRIKQTTRNAIENMGGAISDVNSAAQNISVNSVPPIGADDEGREALRVDSNRVSRPVPFNGEPDSLTDIAQPEIVAAADIISD